MALTKAPEELLDKSLTSALTITTADNTTQLTLTSTDADSSVGPRFDLKRDSASPAASDTLGQIRWFGKDDGGASLSYSHIATYIEDPTNGAEDGKFEIDVRRNSINRSRLMMDSTETVFNNEGVDVDFRVESDGNTHMLFVDGGNNLVGIGTSSNTHNSNTAQTFIVSGGSGGSSQPIVMMIDEDGSVEGGSCILELSFTDDDTFSNARMIQFRDSSATQGTIECSGGGSVAYNTTSDERLKEDIQDTASKWDTLKALKVRDYKWKRSGNANTGFIAQELNEHWPNAVSEGGDNVAQDPWSVDYGKLTPLLTKALQEAIEKIETLEAKVKALEEA